MTKRKCVIDETITCEDFQCDNCPVKDAYNYGKQDGLAEGRKETISKMEKLEKELAESKAREQVLGERVLQLQSDKGKLIEENRELQMKLLTLENKEQVITTTVNN